MGCENEIYTNGLFYRKEQLGVLLSQRPLYLKTPKALDKCITQAQNHFSVLSDRLTYQNIQDGIYRIHKINEAIDRDANNSAHYLITGERKVIELENGASRYQFVEHLKII
jgi:hypothetical protein